MTENPITTTIAVVGVSTLFPGSIDSAGFWKDILAGTDLITEVPATHWLIEDYYDPDPSAPDKTYSNRGAFLPKIDFDPMEWGVPPTTVAATDTCQLLALIVAQRVLADAAKGQFDYEDRERMSVILGVTGAQELLGAMVSRLQRPVWTKALREMGLGEDEVLEACERIESHYTPWQEATFPGVLGNVVAGRIANRLDLGGTNCVTDAACASTFSALSMGINELRLRDSDVVICGGADTMNDIFMYLCFSKTPALSKTGDCRPFSADADGTMLGEGLGMVAIKRLEDAERDGDRIYALIRGLGASSDGRGTAVYAPVASGQARAVRRAYERAGYGPDTVELVEAHGTGTIAGDAAEFEGLRIVFEESGRKDRQWCALGSVKSQIGHTKAAAGAAGLVKAIFSLQHCVLPPTIKVDKPNPKLNLPESPFHLSTRARPWIRGPGHPRRAGVSSFGFGGSNFHVALEEYRGDALRAYRRRAVETELFVLGADSPAALAVNAREMASGVETPGMFAFLARSTQERYDARAPCRLAVVAKDAADLRSRLEKAAALVEKGEPFSTPDGLAFGMGEGSADVGFVFPGQGSQYPDMGGAIAMTWEEARLPWDEAATLDALDTPLHEVVFPRPVFDEEAQRAQFDKLKATEWAQPAIGMMSLSHLGLLDMLGVEPAAVTGHSFGEVIALHTAGVFSREDAIRIARRRGELMAEAASIPGAMTAVSAPVDEIRAKLEEWGSDVVLANHNGPAQVVLSGPTAAIEEVEVKLAEAELGHRRLPVATAFHSSVVSASTVPFAEYLSEIRIAAPTCPIYGNTEAALYPSDPDAIRALLANQLAKPVRFAESIEAMHDAGVRVFLEVGPSSVLTGLVDAILADRPHIAVALDRKNKNGVTSFNQALGCLVAAGVPLDLAALWRAFEPLEDPRTTKTPKLTLQIGGANYGKPYPPETGAAGIPRPNPTRTGFPPPPTSADGPMRSPEAAMEAQTMAKTPPDPVMQPPTPAARPSTILPPPLKVPAPQAVAADPPALAPQGDAWASAYYAIQAKVIDAHTAYTQAIAATHGVFLTAQQHALSAIPAMMSGQPAAAPQVAVPPLAAPLVLPSAPAVHHAPPAPAAAQVAPLAPAPIPPAPPVPQVAVPQAAAPQVAAPQVAAPQPVEPAPGGNGVDLPALMLEIVAEKTGYPIEMLELTMDLEGDLGVDSIKRVEILAAMRERARDLPEVDPAELGKLRTLAEIVERLDAVAPGAAPPEAPTAPSVDLTALMLEVVAEKTGYPTEMLELTMDLEGDLGVDSIKRVEILAAMRERAPDLPQVDPAELAKLRTLAEIVERMGDGAPAAAPSAPAASSVDLTALMLEVVAEKTGYPTEMLELTMDLEGDLGVDSIKRVEILAAMRERAPGLPHVDPAELAKLRTLAEIVDRMNGTGRGQASAGPDSAPLAAPSATRWALRLEPMPANGFALEGLLGARSVAIIDAGSGLASALAERLVRCGVAAEVGAPNASSDGVIFLGGLAEMGSIDDALRLQREAFAAAKVVAARLTTGTGVFVTVQDTGGDFGLAGTSGRAWVGGLPGLVKTAAQEWPEAGLRAIDLERGGRDANALADALADELLRGGATRRDRASGGGVEVALRADGSRSTLVSVPSEVRAGEPRVGETSVILASGGARGVTAHSLIALAAASKARFVLLGRTPIEEEPAACAGASTDAEIKLALLEAAKLAGDPVAPKELAARAGRVLAGREVRGTLAAIESAGGQARYVVADVQDADAVRAALAPVRDAWGPITGIVHGAGLLADRVIADKTLADFDRVFDVKVRGLRTLLDVTADDPLSVLVTFSSVAGRCGNRGQCDYAMANETLNKVVASEAARRGGTLFARSLGWGPWEGGMVTPALRQHFESLGVPLIPLDAGARMLVDELGDTSDAIELVLGGEPRPQALASASTKPGAWRYEVIVDREAFPAIVDHRVKGEAILPVAIVLELFARAVEATRPDLVFTACEDLKVLRGVVLERYDAEGERLSVEVEEASNGEGAILRLRLLDADGRARYSARGFAERNGATLEHLPGRPLDLTRFDGTVYDGVTLFHGDAFQVIVGAPDIGDAGIEATLQGASARGWRDGTWATDPALIDGGLQLALLWTCEVGGGVALPTAVKSFRRFSRGFVTSDVRAILVGHERTAERSTSDIVFVDASGVAVAELRGVEVHVLPGSRRRPSVRA